MVVGYPIKNHIRPKGSVFHKGNQEAHPSFPLLFFPFSFFSPIFSFFFSFPFPFFSSLFPLSVSLPLCGFSRSFSLLLFLSKPRTAQFLLHNLVHSPLVCPPLDQLAREHMFRFISFSKTRITRPHYPPHLAQQLAPILSNLVFSCAWLPLLAPLPLLLVLVFPFTFPLLAPLPLLGS